MATTAEARRPSRALRGLGTALAVALAAAGIVVMERVAGLRSPLFAFQLHFLLMFAAVFLDKFFEPRLEGRWFDVRPWEPALLRRLGVNAFMVLLRRIGWTNAMRDLRIFDGSRRTLASYERATRHGENAHGWLFLIVLAPIGWAAAHGWWDAVLWLGSMNVLFQLYPVLLQRSQRARLRVLLARTNVPGSRTAARA